MRRQFVLSCSLATACVIGSAISYADSVAEAKKAIATNYRKMDAALVSGNIRQAFAFYDKKHQIIDYKGGKHSTASMPDMLEKQKQSLPFTKCVTKIRKFRLEKDKAIVTVIVHWIKRAKNPQVQKLKSIEINALNETIWGKVGGVWKLKQTKQLLLKVKNNDGPTKVYVRK